MSGGGAFSRVGRRSLVAVAGVLLMWAGYTVLQTLFVVGTLSTGWSALLGFLPGILAVGLLLATGLSRRACFLAVEPISVAGLGVLAAVLLFALSAILPFMGWQGWSWKVALLYAPASGISQELFFRSALLPATTLLTGQRRGLILHAVLFGLWHIGPAFVGAPPWAVVAVIFVPMVSGLGWGWQVQRDRTVVWAMLQHSLIWVIGLQFELVG